MVTLKYDLPFDPTTESVPERGSRVTGGPKDQPINMNLLESIILGDRQISRKSPRVREGALDTLAASLYLTLAALRRMNVLPADVNRLVNDFVGKQGSQQQTLMDALRDNRRRLSNPDGLDIATHVDDNWVFEQNLAGDVWSYRLK